MQTMLQLYLVLALLVLLSGLCLIFLVPHVWILRPFRSVQLLLATQLNSPTVRKVALVVMLILAFLVVESW